MKRRSFLKGLLGVPAVIATSKVVGEVFTRAPETGHYANAIFKGDRFSSVLLTNDENDNPVLNFIDTKTGKILSSKVMK